MYSEDRLADADVLRICLSSCEADHLFQCISSRHLLCRHEELVIRPLLLKSVLWPSPMLLNLLHGQL